MRKLLTTGAVAVLASASLGLVGDPARASHECTDRNPSTEIGVGTPSTVPVFAGARVLTTTSPFSVGLCYNTGSLSPGTAGGFVAVNVAPAPTGYGAGGSLFCTSDPGVRQPVTCDQPFSVNATPVYTTSSGTITLSVPFAVCLGGCAGASPNLGKTGVAVGTLSPIPAPSGFTGAGYALTSVEIWVDGMLVFSRGAVVLGGAFVDYNVPSVSTPTVGSTGVCITGGVCLAGMLGVGSSTQTVQLVVPTSGTTSVPVTIPGRCLVNFSGPC